VLVTACVSTRSDQDRYILWLSEEEKEYSFRERPYGELTTLQFVMAMDLSRYVDRLSGTNAFERSFSSSIPDEVLKGVLDRWNGCGEFL
jgi:hypothetical protein